LSGIDDRARVLERIQSSRITERLQHLFDLGREDGSPGAMRLAFSAADRRGRDYVLGLMREAGLSPRIDEVGNLIGARRGASEQPVGSLIIGSHLDTVPNGGMYDGALGVIGGIEVLTAMAESGYVTHHPVEVISFSNEEKARFATAFGGSSAMVRGITPSDLEGVRGADGALLSEAMISSGLDPATVGDARRKSGFCRAYLELHVEQGCRMARSGVEIGVVTAIVGITRARLVFTGRANHAGTTAMEDRRDALWAAAALVKDVRESALASDGQMVGTVGYLQIKPGAANVVAGEASLIIELRSPEETRMKAALDDLLSRARAYAAQWDLELVEHVNRVGRAVPMDQSVQDAISQAAAELSLKHERMASWAGHDASVFASIAPTGMIFVPSEGGISHAPDESTKPEDTLAGVRVLASAVLSVDKAMRHGGS